MVFLCGEVYLVGLYGGPLGLPSCQIVAMYCTLVQWTHSLQLWADSKHSLTISVNIL